MIPTTTPNQTLRTILFVVVLVGAPLTVWNACQLLATWAGYPFTFFNSDNQAGSLLGLISVIFAVVVQEAAISMFDRIWPRPDGCATKTWS